MNYKNLNYEIETYVMLAIGVVLSMNYKNLNYEIETAIPRAGVVLSATMNYKNLNYEIETGRFSPEIISYVTSMNYKNLNYEIETIACKRKQSNLPLNYEL